MTEQAKTRVHRVPRIAMYTPVGAEEPTDLGDLRITSATYGDGTSQIVQDFWRLEKEPNRKLLMWWTGTTMFRESTPEEQQEIQ
eukprot:4420679-Amphidinium_carterae.1